MEIIGNCKEKVFHILSGFLQDIFSLNFDIPTNYTASCDLVSAETPQNLHYKKKYQ